MKVSASNQFKGTVKEIKEGAVNCYVVIDIGSGIEVTSIVTLNAIKKLGLKVGSEAYAIVKATSVMVGVD